MNRMLTTEEIRESAKELVRQCGPEKLQSVIDRYNRMSCPLDDRQQMVVAIYTDVLKQFHSN